MKLTALSLSLALVATAACAEMPTDHTDEVASALIAAGDKIDDSRAATRTDDVDQVSASEGGIVGRFIKLAFGLFPSPVDKFKCYALNMTQEVMTIGNCQVTIRNQDCQMGWSQSLGQYVCSCEVVVVGAVGPGC